MQWLPGAQIIAATTAGGSYIDVPWRVILHTTEGTSIEGAISAYRRHGGWPHMTVDIGQRRIVQHYPFSVSARALKNTAGGVETNRARAIQIEIVGQAARMHELGAEDLKWLGGTVLRPIVEAFAIPKSAPAFVPYPQSYGLKASQRMGRDKWLAGGFVAAHQHVPENDHGDAGAIDIAAVLSHAYPSSEENDMDAEARGWLEDTRGWAEELFKIATATAGANDPSGKPITDHWVVRYTLAELRKLAETVESLSEKVAALEAPTLDVDSGEVAAMIVDSLNDDLAERVADLLAERLAS